MDKRRFGIDLARARESKGLNGHDLARELNLSPTAVHKWESGLNFPGPGKWKAIRDLLGINPQDYKEYKGYDTKVTMINAIEKVLQNQKSKLFQEDIKDVVKNVLENRERNFSSEFDLRKELFPQKEHKKADFPRLPSIQDTETQSTPLTPLITWKDVARRDIASIFNDTREPNNWVDPASSDSASCFAMTIQNDSMEPEFLEGDNILVDPEREPVSGSYIIAKIGTEATLKQYIIDSSRIFFKPLNNRYPIQDMTDVDFQIIGVVVEKWKRYC